jgi:hypothetical protein
VAADAWLAQRAPSGWDRPVGAARAVLAVGALATSGVLTAGQRGADGRFTGLGLIAYAGRRLSR